MRVLVVIIGLIIGANCQFYYNGYDSNICGLGEYPSCSFNVQNWASSTPQITTTSPSNITNSTCQKCPTGTSSFGSSQMINRWYGNTNLGCQRCSQGYYANQTGTVICEECPEGHYCSDPALSPTPCPRGFAYSKVLTEANWWATPTVCSPCKSGTFSNRTGAAVCSICPAGHQCTDPTAAPSRCPPGTSTNAWGYYRSTTCQQCPMGSYAPRWGSSSCLQCPDGFFCPDPTRAIRCPLGTFRSSSSEQVIFPREKISTNYYGMSGLMCFPCPAGYYASRTESTRCIRCPRGSFCADPTLAPRSCPAGTFSNSQYGQTMCTPCPDGTYTTSSGSTRCLFCPKGRYCSDPASAPRSCAPGTFSNSTFGQVLCTPCPPGTYATNWGSSNCLNCPIGMCCNDPTRLPMACPSMTMSMTTSSF